MNNLINKTIILIFLLTTIACAKTQPNSLEPLSKSNLNPLVNTIDNSCFNEKLGKDTVSRVDEKNKRLFIIQQKADKNSVKNIIEKAQNCISKDWKEDWSISFFTDKKYAGYMDELAIENYLKDGSWEKSYLAEYNNQNKTLTLNPITKPEKIEIK